MQKVLIAGATGYLGGFVLKAFKERGYEVRALTRNADKLKGIDQYIDEVFIGEVTHSETIQGICKGVDIVFSSIGITKQKDNLSYLDVDYQGNLNLLGSVDIWCNNLILFPFMKRLYYYNRLISLGLALKCQQNLEQAKKKHISKFIYISVFGVEKMNDLKCVQAKVKFEEALKASGIDYVIIRPNGFFSDMLEYLKMAERGRGYVFGSGENQVNPIHGQDLAKVCVDAVGGQEKEINVGGPEVLTHNMILNTAFDCFGNTVKISKIPSWFGKLMVAVLRAFTSVKTYGPVEFFMTVLANDMVAPAYGKHRLKDFFLENMKSV